METLEIKKETALAAYADAGKKEQSLLENLFGKKVFKGSIRDRIQGFDDVLSELGITPVEFINEMRYLPNRFVAETQLEYIVAAYNEGKIPDYDDSSQSKYWGWFWMDSARGFSFFAYFCDSSHSCVGSRFAFLDMDNFLDAFQKFKPIFEAWFTSPLPLPQKQTKVDPNKNLHWKDIKTLEVALAYKGETIGEFNHRTQFDTDQQRAGKEIEVIAEAIRQGHKLGDIWYYPRFWSARSARGFSFHVYYCDCSFSCVGSRHCLETAEKAIYMGKQFISIYNRYING